MINQRLGGRDFLHGLQAWGAVVIVQQVIWAAYLFTCGSRKEKVQRSERSVLRVSIGGLRALIFFVLPKWSSGKPSPIIEISTLTQARHGPLSRKGILPGDCEWVSLWSDSTQLLPAVARGNWSSSHIEPLPGRVHVSYVSSLRPSWQPVMIEKSAQPDTGEAEGQLLRNQEDVHTLQLKGDNTTVADGVNNLNNLG